MDERAHAFFAAMVFLAASTSALASKPAFA
jgi:hypothetical protein